MRKHLSVTLAALAAASLSGAPLLPLRAQQPGTVAYPDVYHVQFENDWVRLVRVKVPANSKLEQHTHPAGLTMHLYLTDAEPLSFVHFRPAAAGTSVRPAVTARSYRVSRTGLELHEVLNIRGGASEYLRLRFKTLGTESRQARIPAPPVGVASASVVEVENAQFRATRITVAPHESYEFTVGTNQPALLIAMTEAVTVDGSQAMAVGQERFIDGGRRAVIRPQGFGPVQLLRIDFLTQPGGAAK